LTENRHPTEKELYRSSTIVADRLCGAIAEPIVRNAQEKRQLAMIEKYLIDRGYRLKGHPSQLPLKQMEPGTFTFRLNVKVIPSKTDGKTVNIPIDAVIQPKSAKLPRLPLLIEAKSAGDYTNVNKRRKEEATKMSQLRATYGRKVAFVLFLCGYFDAGISAMKPPRASIGYGSIGSAISTSSEFDANGNCSPIPRNQRSTAARGTSSP
jgi:hypothetical protein